VCTLQLLLLLPLLLLLLLRAEHVPAVGNEQFLALVLLYICTVCSTDICTLFYTTQLACLESAVALLTAFERVGVLAVAAAAAQQQHALWPTKCIEQYVHTDVGIAALQ
jgi:hypothetical protein